MTIPISRCVRYLAEYTRGVYLQGGKKPLLRLIQNKSHWLFRKNTYFSSYQFSRYYHFSTKGKKNFWEKRKLALLSYTHWKEKEKHSSKGPCFYVYGMLAAQSYLLKHVRAESVDDEKVENPSEHSSKNGQAQEILQFLREKNWDKINSIQEPLSNIVDEYGRNLLILSVLEQNKEVFIWLIKNRVGVSHCDSDGNSALHWAAHYGSNEFVHTLLNYIKIDQQNKAKMTPLHIACKQGSVHTVDLLLKNGANAQLRCSYKRGFDLTSCQIAVAEGDIECFDRLIEQSKDFFRHKDENKNNLIHLAIHFHQINMLKHLLGQYIDSTEQLLRELNDQQQTPLMLASSLGNVEAILVLVDKKVDIEQENSSQRTALHWAVLKRQPGSIVALFNLKANLNAQDVDGNNALSLAKKAHQGKENDEITALLYNLGKKRKVSAHEFANFVDHLPENLAFKGGGPKGIAYVGAVKALQSQGQLRELKRVAGTSAGAINATLMAMGYSAEEMEDILQKTNLMTFLDPPTQPRKTLLTSLMSDESNRTQKTWDTVKAAAEEFLLPQSALPVAERGKSFFNRLYSTTGVCEGEVFRKWIEDRVAEKLFEYHTDTKIDSLIRLTTREVDQLSKEKKAEYKKKEQEYDQKLDKYRHLTFGELRDFIRKGAPFKHLHVFVTSIAPFKDTVHISSEDSKWDNVIISDAIRASMSIPVAFKPHILHIKGTSSHRIPDEKLGVFVDGGLLKNFPLDAFDEKQYQTSTPLEEKIGRQHQINLRTLGFSLYDPAPKNPISDQAPENALDLAYKIAQVYWEAEEIIRKKVIDNRHRVIEIDNQGIGMLEFNLDQDAKKRLMDSGRLATEKFYEQQRTKSSKYTRSFAFARKNSQWVFIRNTRRDFLPRPKYEEKIKKTLLDKENAFCDLVLYGERSVGKSELAIQFANDHLQNFSLVYWIDTTTKQSYDSSYRDLARRLGIYFDEKESAFDTQRRVNNFLENKEFPKPWLLVVDNATQNLELPQRGKGRVIVTSPSNEGWEEKNCLQIALLDEKEALALFEKITGNQHSATTKKIIGKLGLYPLAINQVAHYLRESIPLGETEEDCLNMLTASKSLRRGWRKDRHYHLDSLDDAWKMTRKALGKKCPQAIEWLQICAYFSPHSIPNKWLSHWLMPKEKDFFERRLKWQDIMRTLQSYSLIDHDEQNKSYFFHADRQEMVRAHATAFRKQAAQFLLNELKELTKIKTIRLRRPEDREKLELCEPHIAALLEHFKTADPSLEKAELNMLLGHCNYFRGEHEKAAEFYHQELSIRESLSENDPSAIARTYFHLSWSLSRDQALDMAKKSLELRRNIHQGRDHIEIAASLDSVGDCLVGLAQFDDALAFYRQSLDMKRRIYTDKKGHIEIADSLTSVASGLDQLGQHQEAYQYYLNALSMKRDLYGKKSDHQSVADALNYMEYICFYIGELDRGYQYGKEAFEMRERLYGTKGHPDLALSLRNQGAWSSTLGQFEKALEYVDQEYQMLKRFYGTKDHPNLIYSLQRKGAALNTCQRVDEGFECYKNALAMAKRVYGEKDHLKLAAAIKSQGIAWEAKNQLDQAIDFYQKAFEMQKRLYQQEHHPDLVDSLKALGWAYYRSGALEKALEQYQRALKMSQSIYKGKDHFQVASLLIYVGDRLANLGKTTKALEHYQQALAMSKRIYKKDHHTTANFLIDVGNGLTNFGKYKEALEHYQQAFEMSKRIYKKEDHPKIANALENIGSGFYRLSRYQEAHAYFQKALKMRERIRRKKDHIDSITALRGIGDSLCCLDKEKEGLEYYQRALQIATSFYNGEDHIQVAQLLDKIGWALSRLNKTEEAEVSLQKALAVKQRLYKEKNRLETAFTLYQLGCNEKNIHKSLKYHQQALEIREHIFQDQNSEVVAKSLDKTGEQFAILYKYKESLDHYQRAFKIRKALYGDQDRSEIAHSLKMLGKGLFSVGECDQGIAFHQKALEMYQRIHQGKDHFDIAASLSLLGASLILKKPHEAVARLRQGLAMTERIYGKDSSHSIGFLNLLALGLNPIGKFEEAYACAKKVIEIEKRLYGKGYRHSDIHLGKLVRSLTLLKRYQEALDYTQEGTKEAFSFFQQENSRVTEQLNQLIHVLNHLDDEELISKVKEEISPLCIQFLGEHHPLTESLLQASSFHLGKGRAPDKGGKEDPVYDAFSLTDQKKFHPFYESDQSQKTLEFYQEALEKIRRLGQVEDSNVTAYLLYKAGEKLRQMEKYQEGFAYYKQAFEMNQRLFENKDHPSTARYLMIMGEASTHLGKHRNALNFYRQALEMSRRLSREENDQDVADALHRVGRSLTQLQQNTEAIGYLKQAAVMGCCLYKKEHPKLELYVKEVIATLGVLQDQETSAQVRKELSPFCVKRLGRDHQLTQELLAENSFCLIM